MRTPSDLPQGMPRPAQRPARTIPTAPRFLRRAFRRHWVVLVVAAVLAAMASTLVVLTAPPTYQATAVVFIEPLAGNPYSPSTPPTRAEQLAALSTEAGLVVTDQVVQAATERAADQGADLGEDVPEQTSTEVPSNSQVLRVSYAATEPREAQVGAQALAESYLDYRAERASRVRDQEVARLDEQIASVGELLTEADQALEAAGPADDAVSADAVDLQEQVMVYAAQLGQLRIEATQARSSPVEPGEILAGTPLPRSPEGVPPWLMALAVAAVLLLGGAVTAAVAEHLRTRVQDTSDLDGLGLGAALGPVRPGPDSSQDDAWAEGYRLVKNELRLGGAPHEVLALLSSAPGAPGAVAARGLAHTLVAAERSVVILLLATEPDGSGPGLAELLEGSATLEDVTRRTEDGVHILHPGASAARLPEMVQRPSFPTAVNRLSSLYDIVLLAAPDATSSTALAAAREAGATVLVATAGVTDETDLLDAASSTREAGGRLAGVLVMTRRGRSGHRADRPARGGGAEAGTTTESSARRSVVTEVS